MDRKQAPHPFDPAGAEPRRETRDWKPKGQRNQDFGAFRQRSPARWDRPENWFRKAPRK